MVGLRIETWSLSGTGRGPHRSESLLAHWNRSGCVQTGLDSGSFGFLSVFVGPGSLGPVRQSRRSQASRGGTDRGMIPAGHPNAESFPRSFTGPAGSGGRGLVCAAPGAGSAGNTNPSRRGSRPPGEGGRGPRARGRGSAGASPGWVESSSTRRDPRQETGRRTANRAESGHLRPRAPGVRGTAHQDGEELGAPRGGHPGAPRRTGYHAAAAGGAAGGATGAAARSAAGARCLGPSRRRKSLRNPPPALRSVAPARSGTRPSESRRARGRSPLASPHRRPTRIRSCRPRFRPPSPASANGREASASAP